MADEVNGHDGHECTATRTLFEMGYDRDDTTFMSLNLTDEQAMILSKLRLRGPAEASIEDLIATAACSLLAHWNA